MKKVRAIFRAIGIAGVVIGSIIIVSIVAYLIKGMYFDDNPAKQTPLPPDQQEFWKKQDEARQEAFKQQQQKDKQNPDSHQ